jgi:hypothetical protein
LTNIDRTLWSRTLVLLILWLAAHIEAVADARIPIHIRRLAVVGCRHDLPRLESLTPRKVLLRSQAGERRYVYADPTSCKCLYVGGEEQFQQAPPALHPEA